MFNVGVVCVLSDADLLQARLRMWYLTFKQKMKVTVEEAILEHYPQLQISKLKVEEPDVHSKSLMRENFELKLAISELRDTQQLLEQDVVTLTRGLNALLQGHALYGERLKRMELAFGAHGDEL